MNWISPILLLFFLGFSSIGFSQQEVTWKDLECVEYKSKYIDSLGYEFKFPIYAKEIKAMDGELIRIQGFIHPLDMMDGTYLFASKPFNGRDCYFIGRRYYGRKQNGRRISREYSSKVNQVVTIQGTLKLNSDDVSRLIYILKNPKIID